MVFETTGKFQLVVGDDDNYGKIMEAVGIPPEKRQKVISLRPICEYSHDGDQYKVSGSAEGFPERSKNFVLNVEQEETTMDGRKVKSTYKRNGKSMVQHEVQENGSTIVYEREIKGDDMHVKISYGNLVANRVFKRL